ncbi:unnamed protein product [Sphagnum compactum]
MGEAESFQRIAMSSSPSATELKAQQQQQQQRQRPTSKRSRRFRICCGATVLLVLALVLVIVVLSQTLFKFRDPEVSIVSVKLETIHLVVDVITLSATLNLSVATDVRVANPNHYDFKYINSTVVMSYHGQLIGDIALGAGEIRAEKSVDLPAVVTVEALKILENPDVLSDLETGIAPLNLTSTIPGRVNLAGIYKHHVVATIGCNLEIWINNQTLKDYQCMQHVKL